MWKLNDTLRCFLIISVPVTLYLLNIGSTPELHTTTFRPHGATFSAHFQHVHCNHRWHPPSSANFTDEYITKIGTICGAAAQLTQPQEKSLLLVLWWGCRSAVVIYVTHQTDALLMAHTLSWLGRTNHSSAGAAHFHSSRCTGAEHFHPGAGRHKRIDLDLHGHNENIVSVMGWNDISAPL